MDWYVTWVQQNALLSAAIQFGILGTIGEFVSHFVRTKKIGMFCTPLELVGKIIAWALLGIIIKYGFTGMKGFLANLIATGLLPQAFDNMFLHAAALSILTNSFFGPQMMVIHRVEDNLILRQWNFDGITKAWKTLVWFWMPAHFCTFLLPVDFQIGLAAAWSLVLGLIMGLSRKK
jgi:hypothetical protein